MHNLPVREMVLYKHGVGFFVREGSVTGGQVALTFRQDEINDVLKSLAVFDQAGGKVLGIHYQTPMDKVARLASSSIRLSNQASLRDLLRDLRGRQVTLELEATPGTVESVSGRVIGLDEKSEQTTLLSVLADDGQVRVFPFDALRAVAIQDSQSEHDLSYFLDTSMSEDERRTVNVRLSEGQHEVVVYYVAPSPTWRVSYRLVAESDDDSSTGKALIQGWGLFDNRLEEDLENVRVTLVAGQPISFIYDLYTSKIPQRPKIEDEARVVPGVQEYQGGSLLKRIEKPAPINTAGLQARRSAAPASRDTFVNIKSRIQNRLLSDLDAASQKQDPAQIRQQIQSIFDTSLAEENIILSRAERTRLFDSIFAEILGGTADKHIDLELAQQQETTAEGKEAGEFFQYVVTTPVSVKRGESALVPIIGSEIKYQRELLYNGAKLPNHPVAALGFKNTTGLTLENGPVTVVENDDYKGEAVVPFTKDGQRVYLPYAVELGVRVIERSEPSTEITRVDIEGEYLAYEEYEVQRVTYIIENTTPDSQSIIIEAPIQTGLELFDTAVPDIETASERRWRIPVKGRGQAKFVRKERRRIWRREQLHTLNYKNLQDYLDKRWLDQALFDTLTELLDTLGIIQEARTRKEQLLRERQDIYGKQDQIRQNLGALQTTGKEAVLRDRLLDQLADTQNRLEAIDREIAEAQQQAAEAEEGVKAIIAGLGATG